MGYLEDFLKDKNVRNDPGTKYSVKGNRWDDQTKKKISEQVNDYIVAAGELGDKHRTGYEAMSDTLLALFKVIPELKDKDLVRPSFLVNHKVMSELFDLKSYDDARTFSVGDPVTTGLAAAELEPDLEVIFDKLSQEVEKADQIEQDLLAAEATSEAIESLMEEMNGEGEGSGEGDEGQDFQEQLAKLEQNLEMLKQKIESDTQELSDDLDERGAEISAQLRDGLDNLNDTNEKLKSIESWGLSPGAVKKMSPSARMELARKLKTRRFKDIADIFGRMQNAAVSEHLSTSDQSISEVYELETGNDLSRLIPIELLSLEDDDLIWDWLHRYAERGLTQYKLKGHESENRGGIIAILDSSSSMSQKGVIFTKAIAIGLLKIAKLQKRPMHVIEFAGVGQYIQYSFDTTHEDLLMEMVRDNKSRHYKGVDAIISFAETVLSGGTCFMTPLGIALDIMRDESRKFGATRSDILFMTDGYAGIHDTFMNEFKVEQDRLGFKIFGVNVGGSTKSEPLNTLCDGQVSPLSDLTRPDDIKFVFGEIRS